MLNNQLGIGLQFYGGAKDLGRDAFFEGDCIFPPHEKPWSGKWIFQSKFRDFIRRGENIVRGELIKVLDDELNKIINKYGGKCHNYIYITNIDLTVSDILKMEEVAKNFKIIHFYVIHFQIIQAFLANNDNIRWQFPLLIGFADLENLLNKEVLERSKGFIQDLKDNMEVFATTDIFLEGLEMINTSNIVILQGPPKMGKTMIAEAIGFAKIGKKYQIFFIHKPNEFFRCYRFNEKQIFICDDVFGQISFVDEISNEWIKDLPNILRKIDKNHQLIWTSRTNIFLEALEKTKLEENKEKIDPSNVIVNVEKLSRVQKAHILLNHIKASDFYKNYNEKHIDYLIDIKFDIINHPNYSPESIRELCKIVIPKFSNVLSFDLFRENIITFLDKPNNSWIKDFKSLSEEEKVFLITLFSIRSNSEKVFFEKKYLQILKLLKKDFIGKFNLCLSRLLGSYIKCKTDWRGTKIEFYHPSIIDIINDLLSQDVSFYELMLNIGGSFFTKKLIKNHKLNKNQKNRLFKLIINEDSLDEISDCLRIIENNYPENINGNDIRYLIDEIGKIEFFHKFQNDTLNFYTIWAFISKFDKFKDKITYTESYIQNLIETYFSQISNVVNAFETLIDILELISDLNPIKFENCFKKNQNLFDILKEHSNDEREWIIDDAIDLYEEFNNNICRLEDIYINFGFDFPLINYIDIGDYDKVLFDENDFSEFKGVSLIKEKNEKEIENIIEFMFMDLKKIKK